jgi:hypothetical protein
MEKQTRCCAERRMTSYGENQAILGKIALLVHSKSHAQTQNILAELDLDETIKIAVRHGLTYLIHTNLLNHQMLIAQNENPDITRFITELEKIYLQANIVTKFIDSTAIETLQTLHKNGINVVVLKGFSLAYHLYTSPTERPKTDIDILINTLDQAKLQAVFEDLGFHNPRGWQPKAIINQFSMKKQLSKGLNVYFDVHLKISNDKRIEQIMTYQELVTCANTKALEGVFLIDRPFALIHAVLHLLHHRAAGDLVKLIWHYDIYLLINTFSSAESEKLLILANQKKLSKVLLYCIGLTQEYFDSEQIRALTIKLAATNLDDHYDYLTLNESGFKGSWGQIRATKGILKKIAFIRETLFPPAAEIHMKYATNSKQPLAYLYLKRIFEGLLKVFKR